MASGRKCLPMWFQMTQGKTFSGAPVHTVWAYNEESKWAVLVTVYRPDPARWIDWRERKEP